MNDTKDAIYLEWFGISRRFIIIYCQRARELDVKHWYLSLSVKESHSIALISLDVATLFLSMFLPRLLNSQSSKVSCSAFESWVNTNEVLSMWSLIKPDWSPVICWLSTSFPRSLLRSSSDCDIYKQKTAFSVIGIFRQSFRSGRTCNRCNRSLATN